jgi:DNA mismatch endonuclease, patch repair protein
MKLIRSFGNRATELRMIAILRAAEIHGWRRHQALPGRPDFTFPKERVVIFIDGCFWHGCPVHYRSPKRRSYWRPKLRSNQARDERNTAQLQHNGWKVIRIWEHALKDGKDTARRVRRTLRRSL